MSREDSEKSEGGDFSKFRQKKGILKRVSSSKGKSEEGKD